MAGSDRNSPPGLSVFFPAYNDSGTIASLVITAIQTASKLTPDYEVIVVNDGSTDATAQILEELARVYPAAAGRHPSGESRVRRRASQRIRDRVEGHRVLHGWRRAVRPVGDGAAVAEDDARRRSGERLQDQPIGSVAPHLHRARSITTSSRCCSACTSATSTATSG